MIGRARVAVGLVFVLWSNSAGLSDETKPYFIRSAAAGRWSDPQTWAGGRVPTNGDRVYVGGEHHVTYDVLSTAVVRSLHLDGVLEFADDQDTRLEVGLVRVGAGGTTEESGFDCVSSHAAKRKPSGELRIGSSEKPLSPDHQALIRLHYVEAMDRDSCPAIVCCGGRIELHGAPLARTWLKLAETADAGSSVIHLVESPAGWRVGDQIILTATTRQNKIKKTFRESTRDSTQTEQRSIVAVDGNKVTLDRPLSFEHFADGEYRGDVANLSRNIIVESAEPAGSRGHTMFHEGSFGTIHYAEFRHLGKSGTLGRYSLHFHQAGDSMRGSSVIGASIWDSHNRWITIHGTNYLVVRDCVGYQSRGHGFFMEDGTEVYNVFDRNLAVQAYTTKPLPKQVLPYDKNDGSGFWWANCLNTFTRNCAADCDEYGYFFQAPKTPEFNPILEVRRPDGTHKPVDIRTLPFVRFEDNEAHCQRRHSFNLGGGAPFGKPNVEGVGPDLKHPFVVRNLKLWNVHWGMHPVSPTLLLDGLNIRDAEYGIWRPEYRDHAYRNVHFEGVPEKQYYAFTDSNRAPNAEGDFPGVLTPLDDQPPSTVVTSFSQLDVGLWKIRGTTSDDGTVSQVLINDLPATSLRPNFAEWEIQLPGKRGEALDVTAEATDASGNAEQTPHRVLLK